MSEEIPDHTDLPDLIESSVRLANVDHNIYSWFNRAKEWFRMKEAQGDPPIFYTGTSRKRAEIIQKEGFKITRAKTGSSGVWFSGADGANFSDNLAKQTAITHAKYKALEDDSEAALISFEIPSDVILLDHPYFAFKTQKPDAIRIINVEYFQADDKP